MTEIAKIQNEWDTWVKSEKNLKITNQKEYDGLAACIKVAMSFKKRIEDFFAPTIESFKKAKSEAEKGRKETIAKMDGYTRNCDVFIREVRQKCKDYENEQEQARIEAENKAQEEAEQKTKHAEDFASDQGLDEDFSEPAPPPPPVKVKPVIQKAAGIGIRRTWKYKIINPSLIPPEYLMPNTIKIGETVRRDKDNAVIPGVNIYYE